LDLQWGLSVYGGKKRGGVDVQIDDGVSDASETGTRATPARDWGSRTLTPTLFIIQIVCEYEMAC
jgi:hypothetical protein